MFFNNFYDRSECFANLFIVQPNSQAMYQKRQPPRENDSIYSNRREREMKKKKEKLFGNNFKPEVEPLQEIIRCDNIVIMINLVSSYTVLTISEVPTTCFYCQFISLLSVRGGVSEGVSFVYLFQSLPRAIFFEKNISLSTNWIEFFFTGVKLRSIV